MKQSVLTKLSQQRKGVSLVELVMVLAISAFMITIALNAITNSGRAGFDDGMKQVLNNLRKLQNEAANGQAPACTQNTWGCTVDGDELFGKGIGFATQPSAGLPAEFKFKNNLGTTYRTFFVRRPKAPLDIILGEATPKFESLPASVGLQRIQIYGSGLTITKGTVLFARGVSSVNSSRRGNSALPFFFSPRYGLSDVLVGGTPQIFDINSTATYSSPQSKTVILTFANPDKPAMTAKIVINTAVGTMEIQ